MSTAETTRLILASSSPRRHALLRDAGVGFDVVPPPIDEPNLPSATTAPAAVAESLAYFKARSVAEVHPFSCVLGADTVCASNSGRILGKPADAADARAMLRSLSGTRHSVITGVALLSPDARSIRSAVTHVTMRRMSEAELEAYVASGEWAGKAGAYAIQETADRYVERLEGAFDNVVGLPVGLVRRMLEELDAPPRRLPS